MGIVAAAAALVLLIAPAGASAAANGTTSGNNFTITDGTDYTGIVGKVVETCGPIIFAKPAGAARAVPADAASAVPADAGSAVPAASGSNDCSASAAGLSTSTTINWGDGKTSPGTLVPENIQPVGVLATRADASPSVGPPVVTTPCDGTAVTWSTCTWDVVASGSTHVYAKPVSGGYTGNWSFTDAGGTSSPQSFVATVNNGQIGLIGVHITRTGNDATTLILNDRQHPPPAQRLGAGDGAGGGGPVSRG